MSETPALLKLIALDSDDLAVLSAHLQDATVRPADIVVEGGRMVLSLNRFVWEAASSRRRFFPRHERRNAVLDVAHVRATKAKGIDRQDEDAVLSLLSVTFTVASGGEALDRLTVTFAGGAELLLDVDGLEARLTDLGGAWATRLRPDHRAA